MSFRKLRRTRFGIFLYVQNFMDWLKLTPVVLSPIPHSCVDRPELPCDACQWAEAWEKKPVKRVELDEVGLAAGV